MRASSNRLPLDRSDATNSAIKDERALGAFVYWEPEHIRRRFQHLQNASLKGSGDFGVLGLGLYNGQGANKPEQNGNLHVVARLAYPFDLKGQFIELNVAAYYGNYTVSVIDIDGVNYSTTSAINTLVDTRAQATLVFYPQPLGFVVEYNVGKGPMQGRRGSTLIESRPLHGGYAQMMYRVDQPLGTVALFPYVRATLYDGGKKFFVNAPHYVVREAEVGVEWQLFKALEVVAAYQWGDRTSDVFPYAQELGQVARLQVQANY